MCGTMASALICNTRASSLEYFSACIRQRNLRAPGSDWPMCDGLFSDMAVGPGRKAAQAREPLFISRSREAPLSKTPRLPGKAQRVRGIHDRGLISYRFLGKNPIGVAPV